jgi:UDP-GlcNAc:undecaprenyl-phosphate GlcNAc-1-phosphate transferase
MRTEIVIGFAVACASCLALVPAVRLVALRTGFVDRPSTRKVHAAPIPYLGGLAIMGAVFAGVVAGAFGLSPNTRFAAILLLAVGLGLVGLADDARPLTARLRLTLQFGAAASAVLLGTRLELTGNAFVDAAVTVVWIVGVTNAFNLLDNMDGLSASIATTSAMGMVFLAVVAGFPMLAVTAAAVVGATFGYLAYNLRPAMIFMGDAGALFLGFLLAILSVRAGAFEQGAAGIIVVPLLVAIALADTTTVSIARRRHGIPISRGGQDHLSHRLVRRGLSPGLAVGALAAANLVAASLAGAVAAGWISPAAAVIGAATVIAFACVPAWRAHVYSSDDTGPSAPPIARRSARASARPSPGEPGEATAVSIEGAARPSVPSTAGLRSGRP